MPYIYYLPDEQLVEVEASEVILETSLRVDIPHTHICGGNARCSTCRVLIQEGLEYCTPRTAAEQVLAERLQFAPTMRLACQTQIVGDGKVTLRRLAIDSEDLELIHDQMAEKATPGSIGQEKKIAILFADIRGFTTFAEVLPPYDVIYVLNRYFHQMGMVIHRHDGMINNYMGDGLMALFGVDNPERVAERAVRAAVDMVAAMDKLNPYLEMLYHRKLRIGIGVHYGGVVVGTVGASKSKKFTAIGDAVNLASRIEAANKQVGTTLLISEEAYQQVKDQAVINQVVHVQIPGKSGEYRLYEVVSMPELPPEENPAKPVELVKRQGVFAQVHQLLAVTWRRLQQLMKSL